MALFHAVMTDETGCEFGVTIIAADRAGAYDTLRDDYPESRVAQLESPQDTAEREMRVYRQACRDAGDEDFDMEEDVPCTDCGEWNPESAIICAGCGIEF